MTRALHRISARTAYALAMLVVCVQCGCGQSDSVNEKERQTTKDPKLDATDKAAGWQPLTEYYGKEWVASIRSGIATPSEKSALAGEWKSETSGSHFYLNRDGTALFRQAGGHYSSGRWYKTATRYFLTDWPPYKQDPSRTQNRFSLDDDGSLVVDHGDYVNRYVRTESIEPEGKPWRFPADLQSRYGKQWAESVRKTMSSPTAPNKFSGVWKNVHGFSVLEPVQHR